jgi:hypothetical protein
MISILIHLLLTILVVFLIFSYSTIAFVTFFHSDEETKNISMPLKVFLWLLSPLVVLDIICEKLFGWSVMS